MRLCARNAATPLAPLVFAGALAWAFLPQSAVASCGAFSSLFSACDDGAQSDLRDIVSPPDGDGPAQTPPDPVKAAVAAFYEAHDYKLVWSGSEEAAERAETVKRVLAHADEQGLKSGNYLSPLARWGDAPDAGRDAAEYDVALTQALFRYARDVRLGRTDPRNVYKDVSLPPREFDVAEAFAGALRHDAVDTFLADLPPPHPGYRWLVDALARYRAIAAQGGWPAVSAKTKEDVLARRLVFEDPALGDNPSDAEVREALLRYQRRNGLDDNGKLDAETAKALDVPASYRAAEIVANMERWRWVPRAFETRYILVNVPDQSLTFVENQTAKLYSRVIIGRKTSPTPLMRAVVLAVVANPAWEIPGDIAARKLLPHLRRDPNYLASRNMVLEGAPDGDPHGANVDWSHATGNTYQIEQNPGPDNVLGTLMLDSPNDFGVYMHDTPDKKLFLERDREISNGCVRVEQILPLAMLALGRDPADGDDALSGAVASGETQHLALPEPLPVYMLYWTAFADADGAMEFRPDRYGRDPPLIARLTGTVPSAAPPHRAPSRKHRLLRNSAALARP